MGLTVLLMIAIGLAGVGIFYSSRIQKYLEGRPFREAVAAYTEGDYNAALEKFDKLLFQEPYSAIYHWYAGKMRQYRKSYTQAVDHYENIIRINHYALPMEELPDIEKFNELGLLETLLEIYHDLGLREKIKSTLIRLIELYPEEETYLVKLITIMIEDKEFGDELHQMLERAISLNERNGQVRYWLALLYYKKGNFRESHMSAERAVHINASLSDAYFFMGYNRIKENLLDEAAEFFRKALQGKEFMKSSNYYLATILAEKGSLAEATSYAKDAVDRPSSNFEEEDLELNTRYFYARLLEEQNDLKSALGQYQFIVSIDSEFKDAAERMQDMKFYDRSQSTEYLNQVKVGDFLKLVDQLIEMMGYRSIKLEHTDANSVNAILEKKEEPDGKIAFFFRRNIRIVDDYIISLLANYMSGIRANQGLLVSTGDATPEAARFASSHKVEIKDRATLEGLMAKLMKK